VREQAHGAGEDVVKVDRLVEKLLDGLALRGAERLEVGELVDEFAVALVGRHAPR
jgi:hypothetical protein